MKNKILILLCGLMCFSIVGIEYHQEASAQTISLSPLVQVVTPTPVGVAVVMSDGTTQTYPLGVWLEFQSGVLRAVMPTQYVNQIAILQSDGLTWKYPEPGRNVQVWRNGVLQQAVVDYTLNQVGASLTGAAVEGWNATDIVLVAYLY